MFIWFISFLQLINLIHKHNFAFMLSQSNIQLYSTGADITTTIEMVDQAMQANFKSQGHPVILKTA